MSPEERATFRSLYANVSDAAESGDYAAYVLARKELRDFLYGQPAEAAK